MHEHEKARDPVYAVAEEDKEQLADAEDGDQPPPVTAAGVVTAAQPQHGGLARCASPQQERGAVSDSFVPESRRLFPALRAFLAQAEPPKGGC